MFRYTKLTALREFGFWLLALVFLLPFYFLITTALKSDRVARMRRQLDAWWAAGRDTPGDR